MARQTDQKQARAKRRGRKYWRAQIKKLAGSGLTVSEYSSKFRIKKDLLYRWRSRLKIDDKPEAKRFIELSLPIREPQAEESYDIYPGAALHIRVGSCFKQETLKRLIEVLRGL